MTTPGALLYRFEMHSASVTYRIVVVVQANWVVRFIAPVAGDYFRTAGFAVFKALLRMDPKTFAAGQALFTNKNTGITSTTKP